MLMVSQQIAVQVAHAPNPSEIITYPAPEPRDIVWANMTPSTANIRTRDIFVLACMGLLLFFWIFPVTVLASLLSYEEIKKVMPWLGQIIDRNDKIRAIVQNSLPSAAMITLNALLPFILEGEVLIQLIRKHVAKYHHVALTYIQGFRARSWVEYSLLKKSVLVVMIRSSVSNFPRVLDISCSFSLALFLSFSLLPHTGNLYKI